jgi:hypothetical protein
MVIREIKDFLDRLFAIINTICIVFSVIACFLTLMSMLFAIITNATPPFITRFYPVFICLLGICGAYSLFFVIWGVLVVYALIKA